MRYILILLLLIAFKPETNNADRIYWRPDSLLAWNDFQGKAEEESDFSSITDWGISFQYTILQNEFSADVKCYFNKNGSWTKTNSLYVLRHEQCHFDLAEVYARKLRQELEGYSFQHNASEQELDAIYKRITDECKAEENRYDDETNHSLNAQKQKEWEASVAAQLKGLDNYKLKASYARSN